MLINQSFIPQQDQHLGGHIYIPKESLPYVPKLKTFTSGCHNYICTIKITAKKLRRTN